MYKQLLVKFSGFVVDVTSLLMELRNEVEGNPDVNEIISALLKEYEILKENSRFLVFVKTRASAKALAKRLPECLKATHLTGGTKSKDKAGKVIVLK